MKNSSLNEPKWTPSTGNTMPHQSINLVEFKISQMLQTWSAQLDPWSQWSCRWSSLEQYCLIVKKLQGFFLQFISQHNFHHFERTRFDQSFPNGMCFFLLCYLQCNDIRSFSNLIVCFLECPCWIQVHLFESIPMTVEKVFVLVLVLRMNIL